MFGRNGILGVLVHKLVELASKLRRDLSNKKQGIMERNAMETVKNSNFVILENALVNYFFSVFSSIFH